MEHQPIEDTIERGYYDVESFAECRRCGEIIIKRPYDQFWRTGVTTSEHPQAACRIPVGAS